MSRRYHNWGETSNSTLLPQDAIHDGSSLPPQAAFRKADVYTPEPNVINSTGRSTLDAVWTITVRAVRGNSVTVPFNVERELDRLENRAANQSSSELGPFTGNNR